MIVDGFIDCVGKAISLDVKYFSEADLTFALSLR